MDNILRFVYYLEGSKIIFQTMSYQNGIGIDEAQQIILYIFESFDGSSFQISGGDAGKPRVVVNNGVIGTNDGFVDKATIDTNNGDFTKLQSVGGKEHFAINAVDAVVSIRGLSSITGHSGLGKAV